MDNDRKDGRVVKVVELPRGGWSEEDYRRPPYSPFNEQQMDDEQWEFVRTVREWMTLTGTRFPSHAQILAVAKSMGYRRVEEPGPLPPGRRNSGKNERRGRRI